MADNPELKAAVSDAQKLLQYASIKGIEVPADLVTHIVGSQALLGAQSDDPQTYKQQELFWISLGKLSALTKPATTESVRHAAASMPDKWATLWARMTRSGVPTPVQTAASELAVSKARWLALVGLLLVVVFQAYYEVGQSTVTKYAAATKVLREEVDKVDELTAPADPAGKVSEAEARRINQDLAKSRLKIEEATEETERRLYWMKTMLVFHNWPQPDANDLKAASSQALGILGVLEGWLALLRNFLLPITWSFLGAALYVSRALADDIRGMAYAPERAILHRSRYYMGMVAGFIAAKFFPANAGIDVATLSASAGLDVKDIAPFAVALLVGYSVEVLFALLDRLIGAFSTK